jgi:AraC family transcriptional regulator
MRGLTAAGGDFVPRVEDAPAMVLAGRNGRFPIGPAPGIKELWAAFIADFGKIEGQIGYRSFGVCHNFDGEGHMDYMAAAEVRDAGDVPGYLSTLSIPARKVAIFVHEGPLEEIGATWARIFDGGLTDAGLEVAPGPQFELYPEDMGADDSVTPIEIHIPVEG